jgi:transcriptional regulator with XRE-family HTH domain
MDARGLKRRRRELRLTQVELAAVLHVDPMTVSRWERGLHPIPEAVALALRSLKATKGKKG